MTKNPTLSTDDHRDSAAGRGGRAVSRPFNFTWPLIIALSACGGGGGGGSGGKPMVAKTPTKEPASDVVRDDVEDVLSLSPPAKRLPLIVLEVTRGEAVSTPVPEGTFDVSLGRPVEVSVTGLPQGLGLVELNDTYFIEGTATGQESDGRYVVAVRTAEGTSYKRSYNWTVDPPVLSEVNQPPKLTFNNLNFVDTDDNNDQNALTVGHQFHYVVSRSTFRDPEGGPITLSLRPDSNLPPGLSFNPATGMISGKLSPIDGLGTEGRLFKVWIVGTDSAGNTAEDEIIFQVLPNSGPVIFKDIEDIDYEFGQKSPILIKFKNHFRDPDGDRLTFTVDEIPVGMKLTISGLYFYGRPTEAFNGEITVAAHDALSGKTITQSFRLTTTGDLADTKPANGETPPSEVVGTTSTSARQAHAPADDIMADFDGAAMRDMSTDSPLLPEIV